MAHHHHHHGHHHHHDHHHTGNIKAAFWLNFGFCIVEFIGGFLTNSMAIMSDALHDLGDSFALGLAWYFQKLSQKKRDQNYSYGYRRFSVLGAVINSSILIIGSIFILQATIPRLFHPEPSNAKGMLIFAILGILVNGSAILRLKKGKSINEKVISLHLLEDVLGWFAVLIGSIVMMFTDLTIIDPILSILITGFVLFNVYKNLKQSLNIFLQASPGEIDQKEVRDKLLSIPNIINLHDMHIWTLDGSYNIMTIHLVVKGVNTVFEVDLLKQKVKEMLQDFHVQHITIEVESENENCSLIDC